MVFDDHEIGENRLLRLKPVIRPEKSRATFAFNPRVLFEESREGPSAGNGCPEGMFIIRISTSLRECALVNEH